MSLKPVMSHLRPIGSRVVILAGTYSGQHADIIGHREGYVAEYVLRTVHGSQRKPGDTLLAAAGDFERDPLACPDCWGLGRGKGYVGTSPGRCWSCIGNGLDPAAFIRPPARSGCPRHAPPDCASRAADDLFDRE